LRADQQLLCHDAAIVLRNVDRRIAHTSRELLEASATDSTPTYGEIDQAIDTIGTVFKRY
jgi:hypothetical protein